MVYHRSCCGSPVASCWSQLSHTRSERAAKMKLEDMLRAILAQNAEEISRAVSMVLDANPTSRSNGRNENLSATERDVFISGYLAGLGYAFCRARYPFYP